MTLSCFSYSLHFPRDNHNHDDGLNKSPQFPLHHTTRLQNKRLLFRSGSGKKARDFDLESLPPFPLKRKELKKFLAYLRERKRKKKLKVSRSLKKYLRSYRKYLQKAKEHRGFSKKLRRKKRRAGLRKLKKLRRQFIKRKTKKSEEDSTSGDTADEIKSLFGLSDEDLGNKGKEDNDTKLEMKKKPTFDELLDLGDDEDEDTDTDSGDKKPESSEDVDQFLIDLEGEMKEDVKENKKSKEEEDTLNKELDELFNKSVGDDNSKVTVPADKKSAKTVSFLFSDSDQSESQKNASAKANANGDGDSEISSFLEQMDRKVEALSKDKASKGDDLIFSTTSDEKSSKRSPSPKNNQFKEKMKKRVRGLEREVRRMKRQMSVFMVHRHQPLLYSLGRHSLSSLNFTSGAVLKPQLLYFVPRADLVHEGLPAFDYIYETVDRFHHPHFASFRIGYESSSSGGHPQTSFPCPVYYGDNYDSALKFLEYPVKGDVPVLKKKGCREKHQLKDFKEMFHQMQKGKRHQVGQVNGIERFIHSLRK